MTMYKLQLLLIAALLLNCNSKSINGKSRGAKDEQVQRKGFSPVAIKLSDYTGKEAKALEKDFSVEGRCESEVKFKFTEPMGQLKTGSKGCSVALESFRLGNLRYSLSSSTRIDKVGTQIEFISGKIKVYAKPLTVLQDPIGKSETISYSLHRKPDASTPIVKVPVGEDGDNMPVPSAGEERILVENLVADPPKNPEASAGTTLRRGPYLMVGSKTAMTVRWETAKAVGSVLKYGTSPSTLNETLSDASPKLQHELRITGLAIGAKYYYSVGTPEGRLAGANEHFFFYTFPENGKQGTVRFWAVGDAGTADDNQRDVRDAYYSFVKKNYTDLWLMLGDNAYSDGTDQEYQKAVFDIYPGMMAQTPLFPARGNHERDESPFYEIFTMPTAAESGGLPSGSEDYYSFDYGNVHFICLDSVKAKDDETLRGMMLEWLKQDLKASNLQWSVAFWHHPPYSRGSHDDDEIMRDEVVPTLEEHGVDLVLAGHSHGYERSYLLNQNTIIDNKDGRPDGDGGYSKATKGIEGREGAVYLVAGSSGKTSSGSYDHPLMYIGLQQLGSVYVEATGTELNVKFLRENGKLDDYFSISKPAQ